MQELSSVQSGVVSAQQVHNVLLSLFTSLDSDPKVHIVMKPYFPCCVMTDLQVDLLLLQAPFWKHFCLNSKPADIYPPGC
jgi:hypothetical protein